MTNTPLRLRAPMGRMDSVRSSVSSGILEYYTPHPLSELVSHCVGPASTPSRSSVGSALAIVHAASRRRRHIDTGVGRLSADALLNQKAWRTLPELLELAKALVPTNRGLREGAAYSGATLAAAARHIYAPSGALPHLMADMAQVLADSRPLEPIAFAAIVGFFCLHAHPFSDGNGRWARLVTLSTGAITGAPWESTAVSLFLTEFNDELCSEVFPRIRYAGAQEFLDKTRLFEEALYRALHELNVPSAADALNAELQAAARGLATGNALLRDLYAEGGLSIEPARARLGLSKKAMTGLAQRLSSQSKGFLTANEHALSIDEMLQHVDAAIEIAIKQVRN